LAQRYVREACAYLEPLPDSVYRAAMLDLADFVLLRGS
jgi:geranylgeranyl pyrophosphate synthase